MVAKRFLIGILVIVFFALLGWAFFPPSSTIAPSDDMATEDDSDASSSDSSSLPSVSSPSSQSSPSFSSSASDDRCKQSPDPGLCKAYIPRYFFDGEACDEFIWGGCGGTVPFETMAECEEACL